VDEITEITVLPGFSVISAFQHFEPVWLPAAAERIDDFVLFRDTGQKWQYALVIGEFAVHCPGVSGGGIHKTVTLISDFDRYRLFR
jgi:hypothetical protein